MTEATPAALPRGIRNNNPGNIRANPTFTWRGQVGADPEGYLIFSSPTLGLRAICMILRHYHQYQGADTVRDYITRWAPPTENPTDNYIRFVCAQTGFAPDEPFSLHMMIRSLLVAIVKYENGEQPYSEDTFISAIASSNLQ